MCYLFDTSLSRTAWADSAATCTAQLEGSYPAEVYNSAQQNYLQTKLSEINFGAAWLGASDLDTEGTFVWESGAFFPNEGGPTAFWQGNQPDNAGGREHCLHLWPSFGYTWNDYPCDITSTTRPLCMYEPDGATGAQNT